MYSPEEAKVENIKLEVYKFEDGEIHYILAYSEEQARNYFENKYSDPCSREDYELDKIVTYEELTDKNFQNDDKEPRYVSLIEIIEDSREFGIPRVLASSVYW